MSTTADYWLGRKFDYLTVIENLGNRKLKVRCDCGTEKIVLNCNIGRNNTRSCGCLWQRKIRKIKTTHGHASDGKITSTYRAWVNMKIRCTYPNHANYKYYGGRGIRVCKEWLDSFRSFLDDMGYKPTGYTLERIDNEEGYSPANCIWATVQQQAHNRRPRKRKREDKSCLVCSEIFRPKLDTSKYCSRQCFAESQKL